MTDPTSGHVDHVDPVEPPTPAELAASAALAVAGVAELHGGSFGEVATYLPGRQVTGVRVRDDGTAVHVSVEYGADVRAVATAVRDAVAAVAPSPVDVTVEDVVRGA